MLCKALSLETPPQQMTCHTSRISGFMILSRQCLALFQVCEHITCHMRHVLRLLTHLKTQTSVRTHAVCDL